MKTKTIYHLNYDCDKVVRIEVIQKTKKKKKSLVNRTKRKERSLSLPPEKICEIYNGLATRLGWNCIDIIEIKKLNKTPSLELPKNKVQNLFCKVAHKV